jgi:hypothetical protein
MGAAGSSSAWNGTIDPQGRQWTPATGALAEHVVHKGLENYGANNCFLNVVLQVRAQFASAANACRNRLC